MEYIVLNLTVLSFYTTFTLLSACKLLTQRQLRYKATFYTTNDSPVHLSHVEASDEVLAYGKGGSS